MRDLMAITRALSDENRVRIVAALRPGDLCVCQIIELLGLAPSTVSKHLFILKQARLVEHRKEGRWLYYRLPESNVPPMTTVALRWVRDTLAGDPRIAEDARRLKSICRVSKETLCCRQRGGAVR